MSAKLFFKKQCPKQPASRSAGILLAALTQSPTHFIAAATNKVSCETQKAEGGRIWYLKASLYTNDTINKSPTAPSALLCSIPLDLCRLCNSKALQMLPQPNPKQPGNARKRIHQMILNLVYLLHSQQRHGERQVPWRVLAGWACMQWVLLATSLLCRAWKALGAVLLGITADGAGLAEEVSAAELSLQSEQKRKTPVSNKLHRAMRWL